MKTTHDVLLVKSATPPSVEVDWDSQSVYVRFRRSRVLKTIARHRGSCFVTVDVDRHGQVVGVEAIGETRIEVGRILKCAGVETPNVDFSRVRYVRPKNKGGKDAGLRAVKFRRRSGNLTDEEADALIRSYGGRPMTKEEERIFRPFFKDPYP